MALSTTIELKNTPSTNSRASKHKLTQQQKKPSTSTKPSSNVPGMNNVSSIVTPIVKPPNSKRVNLTEDDDESTVTNYSNPTDRML